MAAPPPPYGDDEPVHHNSPPASSKGLYVVIPKSELDFIKASIGRAEQYALEARDSSRTNSQTLAEVVKPKLEKVDSHERVIQRFYGFLFAISAAWTAITVGLSLWLSRKP